MRSSFGMDSWLAIGTDSAIVIIRSRSGSTAHIIMPTETKVGEFEGTEIGLAPQRTSRIARLIDLLLSVIYDDLRSLSFGHFYCTRLS